MRRTSVAARVVLVAGALSPCLSSAAVAQGASCQATSFTRQMQSQSGTGLDPSLGIQAQQEQAAAQAAANGAQQDQQTYAQALAAAQQDTKAAIQQSAQQYAQQLASLQQAGGANRNATGGGPLVAGGGGSVSTAPAGSTFSDNFAGGIGDTTIPGPMPATPAGTLTPRSMRLMPAQRAAASPTPSRLGLTASTSRSTPATSRASLPTPASSTASRRFNTDTLKKPPSCQRLQARAQRFG